jgi:hypothetical protein
VNPDADGSRLASAVDQQHLIGVENFDAGFDEELMDQRLVPPGIEASARAPDSFAPEKVRKRKATSANLPARSPASKGGAAAASRE